MKTKRSPVPEGSKGEVLPEKKRQRRDPAFSTTEKEVIERCKELGRDPICAMMVLAVRAAMCRRRWTILELSEKSDVPRSTITEFLNQDTVPGVNVPFQLGASLGLDEVELVLLGKLAMRGEVSK